MNRPQTQSDRMPKSTLRRGGFTLLELIVVLFVLVALAAIVVPLLTDTIPQAHEATSDSTLIAVRDAVARYWQDSGSLKLVPKVQDLFVQPTAMPNYDPRYKVGWNGPYLLNATGTYTINTSANFTSDYGANNDRAVLDAWRQPIVIQDLGVVNGVREVRVVSAGPKSPHDDIEAIDLLPTITNADLFANPTLAGDDRYVAFQLR